MVLYKKAAMDMAAFLYAFIETTVLLAYGTAAFRGLSALKEGNL